MTPAPGMISVSRMVSCKRCGDEQLAWVQNKDGKWYLVQAYVDSSAGRLLVANRFAPHRCTAARLGRAALKRTNARLITAAPRARWHIAKDEPGKPLLIEDDGPWDRRPSVTNDAENVVATIFARGLLPAGRRLFYVDSEGRTDELLVRDGEFVGFAPGPCA